MTSPNRHMHGFQSNQRTFCFVGFESLRPITNLSVINGRVFLGWTSNKLGLGHNTVTPVRLEPAALRSRVKHSTTESLRSFNQWIDNTFQPGYDYIKTCVNRPLKKEDQKLVFTADYRCMQIKMGHSAILSTFIKIPVVIKTFVLSFWVA